ncbi:ergothioneine biosynthesis protein EgtB [Pedobacter suwonensis]|uniref:ergothioneine biosynthesis protein EgtB n=1 Tax=Pedobacter suwonensis TaxID=332999 RepID=UPI0011A0009A|nr:ergothioneine biosynthesis protein EgtB [Pedobacter suwonensis]
MTLVEEYLQIRKYSEQVCEPLQTEDYVVQPVVDVSPPKWHLGHTTWFFETFILKPFSSNYQVYNDDYNFVFNSYYETVGNRVIRTDRGNLSRPGVNEIYQYRAYVDEAMVNFLANVLNDEVRELLVLGFNHEQQHQELLLTDIKYILGNNPLFPAYVKDKKEVSGIQNEPGWIDIPAGVYEIGYDGTGFSFDNELNRHQVYLHDFAISKTLVTNADFLEFIHAGGYENFNYWHSEGWDWVKSNHIASPMYWHLVDGEWFNYTLGGLLPVDLNAPVSHISYYESYAYASWKGMRLPTEFEWEVAAKHFNWGERWEWTESAYLAYPGFSKAPGAIGEYNGKFMVNQKVLRGASIATPQNHSRITYRNFFHPHLRWQYTGIRLVK